MEENNKEPECKHFFQYVEEDKKGIVYQICKRCKRRLIVREDKSNERN